MNANAADLKLVMQNAGITRERAAGLLYVSFDTIKQWLKPNTSKNAIPCPRWAVELLTFKTRLDAETIEKLMTAATAPPLDRKPLP